MTDSEPDYGDEVLIPWGFDSNVRGTVREVYGPPGRRHVLVLLTPELSDYVVAEASTVSLPLDAVTKTASTA